MEAGFCSFNQFLRTIFVPLAPFEGQILFHHPYFDSQFCSVNQIWMGGFLHKCWQNNFSISSEAFQLYDLSLLNLCQKQHMIPQWYFWWHSPFKLYHHLIMHCAKHIPILALIIKEKQNFQYLHCSLLIL